MGTRPSHAIGCRGEGLRLPEALRALICRDVASFAQRIVRSHREEATDAVAAGIALIARSHASEAVTRSLGKAIDGTAARFVVT